MDNDKLQPTMVVMTFHGTFEITPAPGNSITYVNDENFLEIIEIETSEEGNIVQEGTIFRTSTHNLIAFYLKDKVVYSQTHEGV